MKAFVAVVVFPLLASPVLAQEKRDGDQKAQPTPVEIRSDHLTVDQKSRQAVFTGKVRTVQGDLQIHCDKLTVTYAGEKESRAKAGEVLEMLFTGSVSIIQKSRNGHCQRAVYDRVAGRVVCTGDAWVSEGENRIRGERIVYLLEEDEVRVTRPQAVIRLPEEEKKREGLKK